MLVSIRVRSLIRYCLGTRSESTKILLTMELISMPDEIPAGPKLIKPL